MEKPAKYLEDRTKEGTIRQLPGEDERGEEATRAQRNSTSAEPRFTSRERTENLGRRAVLFDPGYLKQHGRQPSGD